MGKDEFAAFLRRKGYKAENDGGSVMVTVPKITEKVKNDVMRLVQACGYIGSYGWRKESSEASEEGA